MEVWIGINGIEKYYQVSSEGRVKSLGRIIPNSNNRYKKEKILTPTLDKDGYQQVTLSIDGKVYTKKVHRLVAEHFIMNEENKPSVNHINGNKADNRVDNLEWATDKEQMKHCKEQLGWNPHHTTNRKRRKVMRSDGKIYNSIKEAGKENNLFPSNIVMCCQGKVKNIGGYSWEYV